MSESDHQESWPNLEQEQQDVVPEALQHPDVVKLLERIERFDAGSFAESDTHPSLNAARRFVKQHPDLAQEIASYIPRVASVLEDMPQDDDTQTELMQTADQQVETAETTGDTNDNPTTEHLTGQELQESISMVHERIGQLSENLRGLNAALASRDPRFRVLLPPQLLGTINQLESVHVIEGDDVHKITEAVTAVTNALGEYGKERPNGPIQDSTQSLSRINFQIRHAGESALSITRACGASPYKQLHDIAPLFRALTDRLAKIDEFNRKLINALEKYDS